MRRSAALLLVLTLALTSALAGCMGATTTTVQAVPYVELADAAPGGGAEFALYVTTSARFKEVHEVRVESQPAGWTVTPEVENLTLEGRGGSALIVRVEPSEDAKHGLHDVKVRVGDARATLRVNVRDVGDEPARDGVGVQVHTVGFWDNGTIFYHNWAAVRDNPRLHWTPLGETKEEAGKPENMAPLKVYVGGERGERPPEPYNRTGYVPVIEGFDERLHGMHAGETGAVRIPPEKAYTRPGNEDHPLFGDNLNFVIYVKSVDVYEHEERTCVPGTDVCAPEGAEPQPAYPLAPFVG